jgi:hypothetical protein
MNYKNKIDFCLVGMIICSLFIVFFGYMHYRNFKVFDYRGELNSNIFKKNMELIESGKYNDKTKYRYDVFPSYNYMLWNFWVWPLDKFLPKENK